MSDSVSVAENKKAKVNKVTQTAKSPLLKGGKYVYKVGRRKSAVAQVRVYLANKRLMEVNGVNYEEYFDTDHTRRIVFEPLVKTKSPDNLRVTVLVKGGGKVAQAEAIRYAFAKALAEIDPEFYKSALKELGILKGDARKKERKKPGLKGARRSPQWSKR